MFYLDNRLIKALNGRLYLHDPDHDKDLEPERIQQIVDMLLPRKIDPKKEQISDGYRIIADLGASPDNVFHAYQAVNVHMKGRYFRAKKYATQAARTTDELRHSIIHFERDMQALMQMEHHPNIMQVHSYLSDRDSNDIRWLLLEWTKGVTLQDKLDNDQAIPYQEQLRILNAIVDGIDCCHSHNILHRNLTPSCIYLTNDGTAKIGDFDFAHVPDDVMETITVPGQPLPVKVTRHMAPELRKDARSADARSDLYALGAIWYDMVLHVKSEEEIDLSRLAETELSEDARYLLSKLLASDPNERPKRAKAVKRWLEQITTA